MKAFTEFYEKKVAQLKKEHDDWVASNFKMRSIELAFRQIKSEGDTDISPAEMVLRAEYEKEKRRNEKLTIHMYDLKDFVRDMEREAEEYDTEWSQVFEIFGY